MQNAQMKERSMTAAGKPDPRTTGRFAGRAAWMVGGLFSALLLAGCGPLGGWPDCGRHLIGRSEGPVEFDRRRYGRFSRSAKFARSTAGRGFCRVSRPEKLTAAGPPNEGFQVKEWILEV